MSKKQTKINSLFIFTRYRNLRFSIITCNKSFSLSGGYLLQLVNNDKKFKVKSYRFYHLIIRHLTV